MSVRMTMNQRGRLLAAGERNKRAPCVFGLSIDRAVPADAVRKAVHHVACAHTGLRYHFPDAQTARLVDGEEFAIPTLVESPGNGIDCARMSAALQEYLFTPFDLASPPLMRTAVTEETDRTLIHLAVDHIVFDGASIVVFITDFVGVLDGLLATGRACPTLAGSDFAEFAHLEADWLASPDGADAERYWGRVWDRLGPLPPLTTGYSPPVKSDEHGTAVVDQPLDKHALVLAQKLPRVGRVPLLTSLATAAVVALGEIGEEGDRGAVFQFARRSARCARGAIGYFNNRVLLPLSFREGRTFVDVAGEVHNSVIGAVEHGMMPFETMAERRLGLSSGRPTSPPPHLYLNTVHHVPLPKASMFTVDFLWPEAAGIGVRNQPIDVSRLTLQVTELVRDEPVLSIFHNEDVFDVDVVNHLRERVPQLLHGTGS